MHNTHTHTHTYKIKFHRKQKNTLKKYKSAYEHLMISISEYMKPLPNSICNELGLLPLCDFKSIKMWFKEVKIA